jgi:hypothetical protein
MKKLSAFLLMIYISLFLWAQDDTEDFFSNIREPGNRREKEEPEEPEEPAPFRLKNRTVELSIVNISVDVSNNFIASTDIFRNPFYVLWNIENVKKDPTLIYQDKVVIDLDDFFNDFKFNLNAIIKPFSFSFNWRDKWGFGLEVGNITATGNILLPENVTRLKKAKDEKFGVGAAVFADVGIPVFFYANEFKVKVRPAAYLPFLYTEPSVAYTSKDVRKDDREGTYFEAVYDMRIYSLVDMNGDIMQELQDKVRDIPWNNFGYDFRLCVEYPWDYDLDIGVDIVNIPIPFAAARLNHYTQLNGKVFLDTSTVDFADLADKETDMADILDGLWDYEYKSRFGYDSDGKKIYRPFTMLFYANYRPSESERLTLIPSLGFSINWLYPQIFAFEGGLSARFDFANIFIPVLGINYNDRKWKNSIDFALNLRAFELDLGLSTQSQNFIKSFQGAGMSVNFGLKFGW